MPLEVRIGLGIQVGMLKCEDNYDMTYTKVPTLPIALVPSNPCLLFFTAVNAVRWNLFKHCLLSNSDAELYYLSFQTFTYCIEKQFLH